ncbi:MAG TPA: alpha/beta fold hydrolase, partial [Pyrinomonadaceae bacterium]
MAEEIDALTRALDFGPYANPLGLPKLAFDDRFVIIPQVELLDASSNEPPGIVLAITPDCMRLSTASRDIVLRNVLTIDGEALPIRELIIGFNLRLGFRIPNLTIAAEQRLAMLTRLCCEHEPFWVGRLQTFLTPLSAPTVGERLSAARADIKHIRTEMVIPAEFMSFVADSVGTSEIQHALLAAFAAFLARLGDTCEFDIGFSHGPLRDDLHELAGVFATHVPLRITLNCEQNFTSALAAVREQVTEIIRHRTYARDVAARYPALRSRAGNVTSRLAELVVECVQSLAAYEPWTASRLSYVIPQQGEQCLWVYDAARLDADVVARISGWFISFLRSLALNPQQSLAELPLPDNDERHRFLADWNNISIVDTQPPAARALFAAQQVVAIAQDNKPGADNSFVPPRDVLEQQIALIWEKALRRRPIGVFDRFFELGGNSLLAAQVFSEIEELVGQVLPLALLIEYPNIDRLTHLLRSKGWTPGWSSLIAMQPDGDGPSLYCIHGYGGNILSYRQLAAALGPALRIYGLQAQGLDGKRAPYTCIEDIAAHYVAEIINFQPEGPFALAGSSFGGWVAFEMARQLRARGRTVSLLALLDASARELSALPQNSQLKYRLADFARRWDDHVRHLLALSPREKYLYLRRRGVAAWARLKMRLQSRLHHTASHLRPQLQSDEADLLRAIRAVNDSCRRAAAAYVPQAYNGRVVLFQAAEQSRLAEAPFKAFWEQLSARGVELRRVPGNHSTMLQEPLVRWLAEEIK